MEGLKQRDGLREWMNWISLMVGTPSAVSIIIDMASKWKRNLRLDNKSVKYRMYLTTCSHALIEFNHSNKDFEETKED